jgi:long-chain acyl-CoA synthetase
LSYLAEQIRAVLDLDPSRPSIYFQDQVWTWGDLRAIGQGLNAKLEGLGLGQAASIGCLLRTRPPHVGALLGVLAGERCITTLNPVMPDEKIAADIRKIRPSVVVGSSDDWDRPAVLAAVRDIGAAGIVLTGDRSAPVAFHPGLETIGAGPHLPPEPGIAVLMLTSGTTGEPKRAPLGYRQLELNIKRAARADRSWSEDAPPFLKEDIGLMFTPLVHIGGLYGVISGVVGGRPARLLERFSVDEWRKAVFELKLKSAGGPPTVLKMVLDANIPKEELASLVSLGSGTAGIAPEVVDEFLRRYDLPVLATYGATEFAGAVCGWSLANFRKYWKEKRGAAGRMHPGVEARTVDPETGEPLPVNTPGLLEMRSAVMGDGKSWVRTSDLARVDADHFLWILGRADNAINRGGFKVHPDEVVKAMEQHPAIREASVVGIPDPRLGAVPVTAYVISDGAQAPSEAELVAFLRDRLTPYQVPVAFKLVEDLPRTPSLKVSMPSVKALFVAEAAAR